MQLLRDERLGRVLVRRRPLLPSSAHHGLAVGVSEVVHGVDGGGDFAGTSTLTPTFATLATARAATELLDEDAEDLTAYRERAKEPSLDLEKVLKDLRRRGKL